MSKKDKEIIDFGVITAQTPDQLSPTLTSKFVRVLTQALEVLENEKLTIKKKNKK